MREANIKLEHIKSERGVKRAPDQEHEYMIKSSTAARRVKIRESEQGKSMDLD